MAVLSARPVRGPCEARERRQPRALSVRPLRVASAREAQRWHAVSASNGGRVECKASGPLKIVIAGAPASGKGTQARREPPLQLSPALPVAWPLNPPLSVS